MRILRVVSDFLDGAEAGIIVLLGPAFCLTLLIGLPGFLAWTLFQEGRFLSGGLLIALFVLTALGVYRDLRARRWTWLSSGLAACWTLCIAYVGIRLLFA